MTPREIKPAMRAQQATPERTPRQVTIDIRRHWAKIEPNLPTILADALIVPTRTWQPGGSTGYEMSVGRNSYVTFGPGEAFISAGLVPRVVGVLKRHGYQVQLTDETRWDALQEPDRELPQSDLSEMQLHFLQAVLQNPRGHFVVQHEQHILKFIALLCTFLPRARMFICVANQERLRWLKRQLPRHTDRPVETRSPEVWSMQDRLFLGTSQLFNAFSQESNSDWDIILFADAESALSHAAIQTCPLMTYQCRYGFLPAGRRLSHREQLLLEHNVGAEIFREPDRLKEHCRRPQIAVVDYKQSSKGKSARGLEAKRRLWHDDRRNRLIAELAAAFAQRDRNRLGELGLVSPGVVLQHLPAETPLNVAILVESVEQGRTLWPHLPGWSFEHQASQIESGDQEQEGQWHAAAFDKAICTMQYAQRYGFGSDVVIRADADQEWPLRETCFGRIGPDSDSRVLVVELFDRAGDERSIERKLNCYQRLGWPVIGRPRSERQYARR